MNKLKKTEGFTLVELIVVIAILGILAAVAVPAYSGYLTKANEAADITVCDAAKTAVFASLAENGTAMPTQINITSGSAPTLGAGETPAAVPDSFATYYGAATVTLTHHSSAVWTSNGGWQLTT